MTPSKVAQRLGQWRTHIKMLEASAKTRPQNAALATMLRSKISTSLETGTFIHIPLPFPEGMNNEDRRERVGLSPTFQAERSASELRLQDDLRDGAEGMRKSMWRFRIGEEVSQLDRLGWYTVMVTLTVDPSVADGRQVVEDGKAWAAFLLRCAEVSRKAGGVPQPQRGGPPRTDYFRHVGVAEHGASRVHHHLHGLLDFRWLPSGGSGTTTGRAAPSRRFRSSLASVRYGTMVSRRGRRRSALLVISGRESAVSSGL